MNPIIYLYGKLTTPKMLPKNKKLVDLKKIMKLKTISDDYGFIMMFGYEEPYMYKSTGIAMNSVQLKKPSRK